MTVRTAVRAEAQQAPLEVAPVAVEEGARAVVAVRTEAPIEMLSSLTASDELHTR